MDTTTSDSTKIIGLIRVSTGKQGESGLGLDAQRDAIEAYAAVPGRKLIRIYEEIQSGKHDDIEDRPVLNAALAHCARSNAVLVVAKIDRLTRSVPMYGDIKRRGVRVVALDIPDSNEMVTDILVAVRAEERRLISTRTKDGLKSYVKHPRPSKRLKLMYPDGVPEAIVRDRAGKLGARLPECQGHLTPADRARGLARSAKKRGKQAIEAYSDLAEYMQELRGQGMTLLAIADRLNDDGHTTRRGKPWNPVQVMRVLNRLEHRA